MQPSFQLPKQLSEELLLFAAHTPALQKYSEISESNTQISEERLGLGEAGTNTWCDCCSGYIPDGDVLKHGCGRHGELQPLLQELLTLHFPQNHQLHLACFERVKDAVTGIFPFSTPHHTKAAHTGSHHPPVTADSSHCELRGCPAHETTSLRWEGAECGHGVARGSPTPVSPCPATHGSARVVFPQGDSSEIHVQAVTPKPNNLLDGHCGGLATNPGQPRAGVQLWQNGELRNPLLLPRRYQLCVHELRAVMYPQSPCSALQKAPKV